MKYNKKSVKNFCEIYQQDLIITFYQKNFLVKITKFNNKII